LLLCRLLILMSSLLLFSLLSSTLAISRLRHSQVTIDYDAVRAVKFVEYSNLMSFTTSEYRGYAAGGAGSEHYPILSYFSTLFSPYPAPFIDIGTRVATSALTLAAKGHPVITYDIPGSGEITQVFSQLRMSRNDWLSGISKLGCNVTIREANLAKVSDAEFVDVRRAQLILLDTYHRPYSTPFEREFIKRLAESRFTGLHYISLDFVTLIVGYGRNCCFG
jgi:hypothetical protein